jgi:hypothetical protein
MLVSLAAKTKAIKELEDAHIFFCAAYLGYGVFIYLYGRMLGYSYGEYNGIKKFPDNPRDPTEHFTHEQDEMLDLRIQWFFELIEE